MNAPAPLSITTFDGSGEGVHPDVVRVPGGFAGYEYWMAFTPYPRSSERDENPSVRASHDGIRWELPAGTPDPLVPAPVSLDEHHADTDLVHADGALHLFYMTTDEVHRATRFSYTSTADGVTWSTPVIVYDGVWGVSPSVVEEAGRWRMWHVDQDTDVDPNHSRLLLREGTSPRAFGAPLECDLRIPGHVLWHVDVIRVRDGYECLAAAYAMYSDNSRCRLFHLLSGDGMLFRMSGQTPIVRPSLLGWDNRVIYRSTFLKDDDGQYRVWYSGGSWGRQWGIGYLRGPLRSLRAASASRRLMPPRRYLRDLRGVTRYVASFAKRRFSRLVGTGRPTAVVDERAGT